MPTRRKNKEPKEQRRTGLRLKALRIEQDLTTRQVADAMGWTTSNLGHYETGRNRLSADELPMLAKALQVDIGFLLERLQFDLAGLQIPVTIAGNSEVTVEFRTWSGQFNQKPPHVQSVIRAAMNAMLEDAELK